MWPMVVCTGHPVPGRVASAGLVRSADPWASSRIHQNVHLNELRQLFAFRPQLQKSAAHFREVPDTRLIFAIPWTQRLWGLAICLPLRADSVPTEY